MPSRLDPFAGWLRGHAVPLTHLDPEAPLDDLKPLREFVGDARVVPVGENSHFITEFSHLRRRILRFLAEHCGFTVLAFEFGFSGVSCRPLRASVQTAWETDNGDDFGSVLLGFGTVSGCWRGVAQLHRGVPTSESVLLAAVLRSSRGRGHDAFVET
ncbi:hypothetical protein ACBJ59_35985 [Nonomuraea sp. MTCD27]|uniref:hypothetical protein n=1 Tax=Nonomuraea sp. MTCD27 TaxID=1676747 RepID=UPI0035BF6106